MSLVLPTTASVQQPAATVEAELKAKLPEIFAKALAHYQALDASARKVAVAEEEVTLYSSEKSRLLAPRSYFKDTGKLDMCSIYWWTTGFLPGSLWYLYEATGDKWCQESAEFWMERLRPNAKVTSNHDVGFIMYCSFGNARRILKTDKYDEVLTTTANSLCQRYDEALGLIRSWGKIGDKKEFFVIPDNMMNLELLMAASTLGGTGTQPDFKAIAISHADKTMMNHFRADGGCYHVLNYDQRPGLLGAVQAIKRGQGLSCHTAWSRGQSWGIYGYTMMYRFTKDEKYLAFAKKLADYAINHPNMPTDGVPYWDYGAPGEERDSSAAAIMASALLELSEYIGEDKKYRAFAVKQLLSLASPEYFSQGDEIGHFLLKHGVGSKPQKFQVDVPLDYGDYYFLEALLRFQNGGVIDTRPTNH